MHVCWGEGGGEEGETIKRKENLYTKTVLKLNRQCSIHLTSVFKLLDKF